MFTKHRPLSTTIYVVSTGGEMKPAAPKGVGKTFNTAW